MEYIFGLHAIAEVIRTHPERIKTLWVYADAKNARLQEIINAANKQHLSVQYASKQALQKLIGHDKHQNIVAHYQSQTMKNLNLEMLVAANKRPLFLILDGIQDPHNLGACLRTANAFGVTAVISPKNHSAPLTAAARKVAAGAAELTPYLQVTNLARTLKQLQDLGIWIVGTALNASGSLTQVDGQLPLALVMGAEDKGMRELTAKHCDFIVSIPMQGQIQSLNVSVATGVCLYEIQRQRQ